MQIILLEDVANVGNKYQEAEVANGYGTNYLIPNGLAVVANEANQKRFENQRKEAEASRQAQRKELAKKLADIDGEELLLAVDRAGEQGQLYSGIYPKTIAVAVAEQFDLEIAAADIERNQPISKVGEYEVDITILDDKVTLTVVVESDTSDKSQDLGAGDLSDVATEEMVSSEEERASLEEGEEEDPEATEQEE